MNYYYSTFVPGLLEPVKDSLLRALKHGHVRLELDGLIAYETIAEVTDIGSLGFVTNTFRILKSFPRDPRRTMADMASQVLADRSVSFRSVPRKDKASQTFRVITSVANRLVPLDERLMKQLEQKISSQTGLRPNRSKPDHEFWLLQRSEGFGFFALRISHHKSYDKMLQKGELRPELANVLCRLSRPSHGELFLDPFCGSGAIPLQRARFPLGLIFASDSNQQKIDSLKQRIRKLGLQKKIIARCENALDLRRYQDGSIHKIVTDPPWGHFESTQIPLDEFYDRMLAEFCRLLTAEGLLVVLTAQNAVLETSVQKNALKLDTLKKFNILLSGKKAAIYVLLRK